MSVKTKKRFKNLGKKAGVIFFLLLMFTNINLILFDDNFGLNHFNFVSDIIAKQAQAGDGNGGGGGGWGTVWVYTGVKFWDARYDRWMYYYLCKGSPFPYYQCSPIGSYGWGLIP